MPTVARSRASTIALDFTWRQTRQANSRSPHSLGRRAPGDDLHVLALVAVGVAVLDQQAAGDLADVGLAEHRQAALLVLEDADVLLRGQDLERAVS